MRKTSRSTLASFAAVCPLVLGLAACGGINTVGLGDASADCGPASGSAGGTGAAGSSAAGTGAAGSGAAGTGAAGSGAAGTGAGGTGVAGSGAGGTGAAGSGAAGAGVGFACTTDGQCNGNRCDPATHRCVECVEKTDCGQAEVCNAARRCTDACTSNAQCGRHGADFCDVAAGACVECLTNANCGGSICRPDRTCP